MLREATLHGRAAARDPIRWRGREVSRLEALTDGMFAIAITLLVVSTEVPTSYDALMGRMSGFFAFGLCFAMMIWIWSAHNQFFRRFGLTDGWTVALNSALVFVVLFFVYPLKFVASALVAHFRERLYGDPGPNPPRIAIAEIPSLFVVYGLGFVAVYGLLGLLYVHAARAQAELNLDPIEREVVRGEIGRHLYLAAIGALSVVVALTTRSIYAAGFCYWLIGPVEWWHGNRVTRLKRQRRALAA